MSTRRFEIKPRVIREFHKAAGTPDMSDDEYAVALMFAAMVRELLDNRISMFAGVAVSKEYIAEIMERGAWLEIDDSTGTIDVRVLLK